MQLYKPMGYYKDTNFLFLNCFNILNNFIK